jgi:predicted membrane protein
MWILSSKTVHLSIFSSYETENSTTFVEKFKKIMNTQKKSHTWVLIGTIFVLLGAALIARNTGLIPRMFQGIIVSWQMLLIVIGVISIVKHRTFHFHGLSLICIGMFFMIPKLARVFPYLFDGMDADKFVSVYWPVLLIVGGILLIVRIPVSQRHRWHRCRNYEHCNPFGKKRNSFDKEEEDCSLEENFCKTSIFGNGNYIVIDTEFKGGTLQAIFGGIELDLRRAYLAEGETILTIEAIFGGISLFVPDKWQIEVNVESVLGGTDDNRRISDAVDVNRKLIIKGSAVFGGIEIRN